MASTDCNAGEGFLLQSSDQSNHLRRASFQLNCLLKPFLGCQCSVQIHPGPSFQAALNSQPGNFICNQTSDNLPIVKTLLHSPRIVIPMSPNFWMFWILCLGGAHLGKEWMLKNFNSGMSSLEERHYCNRPVLQHNWNLCFCPFNNEDIESPLRAWLDLNIKLILSQKVDIWISSALSRKAMTLSGVGASRIIHEQETSSSVSLKEDIFSLICLALLTLTRKPKWALL